MRMKSSKSSGLSLATKLSEPEPLLENYSLWVYGQPKIGKTTFSAQFKKCHHFMFEPGAKSLRVHQRHVLSWADWLEYQQLWAKSDFVTATVDVVEMAYDMSFKHTCQKLGIEHPADENDMGKSWGRIRADFMESMQFMQRQYGKGVVFISHASCTKRKTADGGEIDDIHPALTGRPMEALGGSMDVIAYMHVRRDRRVMQIRGDENVWAGCRLTERFRHTDGSPVIFIPMGDSDEEAYANFVRAFNNKLSVSETEFVTKKRVFTIKKKPRR